MSEPAVELIGIEKRFGEVVANRGVSLRLEAGRIHALIGENGAGKSTLAGILYGHIAPDAGELRIGGRPHVFRSPKDAIAAGIGMVHQHFMLVETMSVLENLLLGNESGLGLRAGRAAARATLRRHGAGLDPEAPVETLPVGLRQQVELVKALHRGAQILILDEPTAVLTPFEAERLFRELHQLAAAGKTILLVTHKLSEVMRHAERVTVLRHGEVVGNHRVAETSAAALAERMIGRSPAPPVKRRRRPGDPVLEASELSFRDASGALRLDRVSFRLHAGEILGIAGVAGNGQSELIEALIGLGTPSRGSIRLAGREVTRRSAGERRRLGLGHIAEDRLRLGAIGAFSAAENALLGREREPRFSAAGLLRRTSIDRAMAAHFYDYDIRPRRAAEMLARFSGGNQQKLVVAREIERAPRVLVAGHPTRGVDVGAAELIHRRLLDASAAGAGVLLISADLDEIRLLADRILVLSGGRITGELAPEAADERRLGLLMAGDAA